MKSVIRISNGELMLLDPKTAQKYRPMSDLGIFAAVRRGDSDAAVFLVFHRYGDVLTTLVAQYADRDCRDRLLSELVSELYCHLAAKGWEKALPDDVAKVRGYLYTVERNLLLRMRMRDFNYHARCTTVSVDEVPGFEGLRISQDNPAQQVEDKDYVERMLATLSATRRFILCKKHIEGYQSAEVAAMLPAFWDTIGEKHIVDAPTQEYVDNIMSRTTRKIRQYANA